MNGRDPDRGDAASGSDRADDPSETGPSRRRAGERVIERFGRFLRRRWPHLTAVTLVVLSAVVPWVLVADVHSAPGWDPIDTDRPPDEVMETVGDQLLRVDHRRITRVTVVQNGTRVPHGILEEGREYSHYQYVASYQRLRDGPSQSFFGESFAIDISIGGPRRVVQYADDSLFALGYRARLPQRDAFGAVDAVGNRSVGWNRTFASTPNVTLSGLYRPYFTPEGGGWKVVARNESVVVLGIDDPAAVYRTVPLRARGLYEGTRVRAVLDAETGQPERIVTHWVVDKKVGGSVGRQHYVFVTTFRAWGTADVREPDWVQQQGTDSLVTDLLYY